VESAKILIVDTYPAIGQSLAFALDKQTSFTTQACTTQDDIPDSVRAFMPDIIVINVHQAEAQAGLAACRMVAELPGHQMIVLFIPAALMADAVVMDAIEAGADGVLCREDTDFSQLVESLGRVQQGHSLLTSQQLRTALAGRRLVSTEQQLIDLTPREQEVAELIAKGASTEDIASQLTISLRTAYAHIGSILAKLGVSSRVEAVVRLYQWRLLGDSSSSNGLT